MTMACGRHLLLALMSMASSFVAIFVVAEISLRFLPVATGLGFQPVDERRPMAHLAVNRDFIFSKGWNFELVEYGRVNNVGFVNDQDYDAQDGKPLLAVIGDSYIEATMVPHEATIQGRLERAFSGERRVYSFGVYGAPLSQYLAWAKHARDVYRPDALLLNIVGNDFDESLLSYGAKPGFHQFVPDDAGELTLQRNDYLPGRLKTLLRHSALVRYLVMTLDAPQIIGNLAARLTQEPTELHFGFTSSNVEPSRVAESKKAIDSFLSLLSETSGLPPERILLVVNGLLEPLYDPGQREAAEQSYFALMRDYFLNVATVHGYRVLDLDPYFAAHYRAHGKSFRFRLDGHWNSVAHGVAAEAVASVGFPEPARQTANLKR